MTSYGLALYRGDTYRWQFLLWADTNRTVPVALDNVRVAAEVRKSSGTTPALPLVCTVTLPNRIDMELSAAACAQLPDSGGWDLQLVYPSGDVQTVVRGAVSVTGDITESVAVSGGYHRA